MSTILPLTVTGASVRRRGKRLIGPVDLSLSPGGATIVIGPNGAGKTTLLRLLHGIERLSAGGIRWSAPEAQARARQAFVFQTPVLMRRSVEGNLCYPLLLRGVSRAEARIAAAYWVGRIGLGDALARPARQLSGGERQKLALARALIAEPELLFLDEPCANLDGRSMREIEELLQDAQARGTRIVMSTHDMGQARRLACDVWFVYNGRLHETGPAEAFFAGPETSEAQAFLNGDLLE